MTAIENPLIQAKALGKFFELPKQSDVLEESKIHLFDCLNFNINPAETVSISGSSGSGKSTLISLLAGLEPPSTGQVKLFGQSIYDLDENKRSEIRLQNIGFIFQSFQLIDNLTALENITMPLDLRGQKNVDEEAKYWLQRVGLSHRANHYPTQLSGGEQQRVAIARAFISKPSLLFADEPTGNLDQHNAENIIDLLFEINQENQTTLLIVTHDQQLAQKCQRQLILNNGKINEAHHS